MGGHIPSLHKQDVEPLAAHMSPGLADTLRMHVQGLHACAERSGIVSDILKGRAGLPAYALLLRNLLPCYQALEAALEQHSRSPTLRLIARPELYRSASIIADLTEIATLWQSRLPLLPQSAAYAACIARAGNSDGSRLIAHAYTRYLGDLNGGAIILRKIQAELPGGALRFHEFPMLHDITAFKMEYRAAFDIAGALLNDWPPVLHEAAVAFEHNIALSNAVRKQIECESQAAIE